MDPVGNTTPAKRKRKKSKQVTSRSGFRELTVYQRIRDAAVRGVGLTVSAAEAAMLYSGDDVRIQANEDDKDAVDRTSGGQGELTLSGGRGLSASEQAEAAAQADAMEST